MKRMFDLLFSTVCLIVLSPIFLVVSAAIRADSPGPAFFRQERVGKDGVPFRIFKFRSMVAQTGQEGPRITAGGDTRITRVGRFLRRTKLDELPQLINVWKGEMSVVGPRPEIPEYVAFYDERQRKVLSVRPGITDPASIAYAHEEGMLAGVSDPHNIYLEKILPHKLELNLEYLRNLSLRTDIALILKTLARIVGKNAFNKK